VLLWLHRLVLSATFSRFNLDSIGWPRIRAILFRLELLTLPRRNIANSTAIFLYPNVDHTLIHHQLHTWRLLCTHMASYESMTAHLSHSPNHLNRNTNKTLQPNTPATNLALVGLADLTSLPSTVSSPRSSPQKNATVNMLSQFLAMSAQHSATSPKAISPCSKTTITWMPTSYSL